MKTCSDIFFFFISLSVALMAGQVSASNLIDPIGWYVDAVNGNDANGTGSVDNPFKSLSALLAMKERFPGFVRPGDTIYLAEGNYDAEKIAVDIAELRIEGTLDNQGKPISVLGKVVVTADKVTIINCVFLNAGLKLQNVRGVTISNNLFSGTTENALTLLGASRNIITRNRFESSCFNVV